VRQAVVSTGPAGPSELLERAGELAAVSESLGVVQTSSRGHVVLVSGEAGVGKTSLLRTFAESLGPSVPVLWGTCDPLFAPRPLGPLLVVAEGTGGELEDVVRAGAMPHEVVSALVRQLRARATSVFVLEDLHWADEATLDVLRLLARRVATVPTLVVATYRDDELDNAHPLRRVLGELATTDGARRLRLSPLSRAAVARLAGPHGVDANELYRKTAGNPFFVVEALAAAAEDIPGTVRDAVLARAAPLSPPARTVLEVVAVVPPQAELWLVEAIFGGPVPGVDECVASGMLCANGDGVAFRHELARLAIEGVIGPSRKIGLHRKALAALAVPPSGAPDLARLAHHAEEAGDAGAVLRFAPAAAERAASTGAHREAAAQYGRVLRFGGRLSVGERAELYERRSRECYLTDQNNEATEAAEKAIGCRRELGDKLGEGGSLRWLSHVLWCPGRTVESERAARAAVALLEALPPGRELAMAYGELAWTCANAGNAKEATGWGHRELELAKRLGDTEITLHARGTIGACQFGQGGVEELEASLAAAQRSGLSEQAGLMFVWLVTAAVQARRHDVAARYLEAGLAYCGDRGLELYRFYLLAYRARLELDRGRWSEAADLAQSVLGIRRTSTTPRIIALVVLGLVRARRGDPGHWPLLDEALALAGPTGELSRLGPVAAARAEAAWLEGDRDAVARATEAALALAIDRGSALLIGELAVWRRRAGLDGDVPRGAEGPFAMELTGQWARAAELWTKLGCPYEAALALGDADDEEALRQALTELQRLEARPVAAIVARRLRERGARTLPRGPRPATRQNRSGLTARELEVLGLVVEGLPNRQIADRLVLSVRTVDHHVEAVFRKLGVRTRIAMKEKAIELELVGTPE
jgi:DNA-binding CsgD family transcriptional regulator/tetratricopeptide (TPR) repeat protein